MRPFPPSDVTLADNILVGTGSAAVTGTGGGLKFQGNILFGAPAGTMPSGGFRTADPKVTRGAGNLFRPTAGSPAIGAATGSFPAASRDIGGQARTGAKDVGADEFDVATPARPLTTADVGPKAA